jgi:hypothetical protein
VVRTEYFRLAQLSDGNLLQTNSGANVDKLNIRHPYSKSCDGACNQSYSNKSLGLLESVMIAIRTEATLLILRHLQVAYHS